MVEVTNEEWAAAEERGRVVAETEPHARLARYDRETGLLVIELTNGATFAVPAKHLQGLQQATSEQLAAVEVGIGGYALHWEELDADFTVPGLLAGRFGTAAYMSQFRKRKQDAA